MKTSIFGGQSSRILFVQSCIGVLADDIFAIKISRDIKWAWAKVALKKDRMTSGCVQMMEMLKDASHYKEYLLSP